MQYLWQAADETGKTYPFEQKETEDGLILILKKETFAQAKKLYLLEAPSAARAGADGYFIVPRGLRNTGDLCVDFRRRADAEWTQKDTVMAFYGIKKDGLCCLVRLGRTYRYGIRVRVRDGIYSVCAVVDFDVPADEEAQTDAPYADIRIEIVFLSPGSDYNDMAAKERALLLRRGEIVPLTEKCRRSAVEYARRYPLVRIRMGWKPSPSPVKHQTEETEPDMFVACTFRRVRELADALKKRGVAGAELQLVGWNRSGHDGRFPQLFPADERLGGDAGLRETIEYVKSLGYRISTHTNNIDAVEIADCFDWNDICVRKDGGYLQIGHYSGGLTYRVCPARQRKNAERELPKLASYGENGLHFTDVVSIVPPDLCFSAEHPVTSQAGVEAMQGLMRYTSDLFGGFSSEGCMDFAVKYIDYGLYVSFGDGFGHTHIPLCDRYLPIWELIYHGTVLYNPLSTTVNHPIKTPFDRLTQVMRGGRPTLYVYSRFRTGGAANWMGETDLTCDTEAALNRTADAVAQALAEYGEEGARRQLLYMTRYDETGDGVACVTYSDGMRMAGNFSDSPRVFEGITIPPFAHIDLGGSRA